MFYGLLTLLYASVEEFQRLSAHPLLWTGAAAAATALLGTGFLWAGRSVYRDWRPGWGLGALTTVALPITLVAILALLSSGYIRPAIATTIGKWQASFLADKRWTEETFRLQYQAVKALRHADGTPVENLTDYPAPESGGTSIPVKSPEAKTAVSEIDSRRVAEHFQRYSPLLNKLLWTRDRPMPEVLRRDMEQFFTDNPKAPYEQDRGVKLAAKEMQALLAAKIGPIVFVARLAIGALLVAIWLPLFGLALYDAWKQLEPATGRL